MMIDIHTHVFPEKIAARTIAKLALAGNVKPYSDGTKEGLLSFMRKSGVQYSFIMPVVTNPSQEETINRVAIETNEQGDECGVYSFGGIHPDNENYKEIICKLADNGVKGIKIHPQYQEVPIDDIRYLRIIGCASEHGLIVLTHGGYDPGYPSDPQQVSSPKRIRHVLDEVKPTCLIAAHMGGWSAWDEVEEYLVGQNVWFDTSVCMGPRLDANGEIRPNTRVISDEQFCRIVRTHGADRVLFGSDYPWSEEAVSIEQIRESGLDQDEINLVLGGAAQKLLFPENNP